MINVAEHSVGSASPHYRLLVRDINDDTISDWIADFNPSDLIPNPTLFPLTLLRQWKNPRFLRDLQRGQWQGNNWADAVTNWESVQGKECLEGASPGATLVPLDDLYLDNNHRWWKEEDPNRLQKAFEVLRKPTRATIRWLAKSCSQRATTSSYFEGLETRGTVGAMPPPSAAETNASRYQDTFKLAESELELVSFGTPALGFWNTRHALLSAIEFIDLFGIAPSTAEALRAIVGSKLGSRPICHTRLVRSAITWVAPLLENTDWNPERIALAIGEVRIALFRAGVRAIGAPYPIISEETSLLDLIRIFGDDFLSLEKALLLANAGIEDLRALLDKSPRRLLRTVPLMPADVRTLARVLGTVGYVYPFTVADLLTSE